MPKGVACKKTELAGTTPFYISTQLPAGCRLLKIDINNPTTAGTDFSVELNNTKDAVGQSSSISLIHHEVQTVANKNISWEAATDWTIGEPWTWIVALVDGAIPATDLIAMTVTYEVDS